MNNEYNKDLPPVNASNKVFWEAAKKHELMAYKCLNCGTYYWPIVDCVACDSPRMEWSKVSGFGKIYSFTIVHQLYQAGWKDELPYNVTWVKLDEGPIFMTNMVNCKNEDLHIGMRVQAVFKEVTDEITLPKFSPALSGC
jgi:uncharacterized OB-fold protein